MPTDGNAAIEFYFQRKVSLPVYHTPPGEGRQGHGGPAAADRQSRHATDRCRGDRLTQLRHRLYLGLLRRVHVLRRVYGTNR
jgi:hypothetical protein